MKQILLFCCLIGGATVLAQSENPSTLWQISLLPKQWIALPVVDSNGLQILVKGKQKDVLIAYTKVESTVQWNRYVIVMDSARRELLRKPLVNNQLAFRKTMLYKLGNGKSLYLYSIAIPTDERRARTVRVRTVLLTKLVW